MTLEAIVYRNQTLQILDQLLLPTTVRYEQVNTIEDGWQVIKLMKVRGAPAIAIVAMLSISVECADLYKLMATGKLKSLTKGDFLDYLHRSSSYLCTARPTAVNIRKETNRLLIKYEELVKDDHVSFEESLEAVIQHIERLLVEDIATNRAIGDNGAKHIINASKAKLNDKHLNVLTHCNTGSLATAGYGTALGVIRSLKQLKRLACAYCTETRPYGQGARLTAYEFVYDCVPGTLIADTMVAVLLKDKQIDAIVVGADRVVANGDTANKIGTYQLAVLASYHQVPFYVASPLSTIDLDMASGDEIPIEERPHDELRYYGGVQLAPNEINCWNPAFDVTPAKLITGIITEVGVFKPEEIANIKELKEINK